MENRIRTALRPHFPNAEVRVRDTPAGWLAEIVHPAFVPTNYKTVSDQVSICLQAVVGNDGRPAFFWKVYLYSHSNLRFAVMGILHTMESEYDEFGVETVMLAAGDAYVHLTEMDMETMQLADYNGMTLIVAEAHSEQTNVPILPYQPVNYRWLEANGGHFGIARTAIHDAHANPRLIAVTLSG